MPPTQESVESTALSRELADFLVELSTALHKYTMYPDGHPLLETAVSGVARRLKRILEGVEDNELTEMLKAVARDGSKEQEWPHVRLLPLSYDQLALTGDEEPGREEEKTNGATSQLWMRLAKSAVGGAHGGAPGAGEDLLRRPRRQTRRRSELRQGDLLPLRLADR